MYPYHFVYRCRFAEHSREQVEKKHKDDSSDQEKYSEKKYLHSENPIFQILHFVHIEYDAEIPVFLFHISSFARIFEKGNNFIRVSECLSDFRELLCKYFLRNDESESRIIWTDGSDGSLERFSRNGIDVEQFRRTDGNRDFLSFEEKFVHGREHGGAARKLEIVVVEHFFRYSYVGSGEICSGVCEDRNVGFECKRKQRKFCHERIFDEGVGFPISEKGIVHNVLKGAFRYSVIFGKERENITVRCYLDAGGVDIT